MWNSVRGVSICSNLSSASASIITPRGKISASWQCAEGSCDVAGEGTEATIDCFPGVIENITFASFGTPVGTCDGGLAVNHSCHSNQSMGKVEAACLGKSNCSVLASDDLFGDPCLDVKKVLALKAVCTKAKLFTYDVSIPVGTTAQVIIPKMGSASPVFMEGSNTIYSEGKFVPGTTGVIGATDSGAAVSFATLSGDYVFSVE